MFFQTLHIRLCSKGKWGLHFGPDPQGLRASGGTKPCLGVPVSLTDSPAGFLATEVLSTMIMSPSHTFPPLTWENSMLT